MESLTPEEKQALNDISKGRDVEKGKPENTQKHPKATHFNNDEDDQDDGDLLDNPNNYDDDDVDDDKNVVRGGGSDSYELFMDLFPDNTQVSTGSGKTVYVAKWKTEELTLLKVTDGEMECFVEPFYEDNVINVKVTNGGSKSWNIDENRMPRNEDSMEEFIQSSFLKKFLPGVVNMIRDGRI